MRQKLIVGLMVPAWGLYSISLFLPAVDLRTNTMTGDGDGSFESGLETLQMTLFPVFWLFVFPFVYFLINFVFLLSMVFLWRRLRGQSQKTYRLLIVIAAMATWVAPAFVDGVAIGYFAWSISINLAAVAFFVPLIDSRVNPNKGTKSFTGIPGTP